MSYFGVSTRNGVGLSLGTVPSLANTPLSYRLAPSLNLEFAGAESLDPRITFSRTSNATLTNSDGLIAYAPNNLLTFSEQFDNAAWVKNNSATVVANSVSAPNGATTADTLTTSATVASGVFRFPTTVQGAIHIISASFQNSSGATDIRFGSDANPATACVRFNAVTGVITSSEANVTASSVINEGGGWYRVSVSFVATASSCGLIIYNGTAVSLSFNVWGAQLNVGALQPYYTTTVKNLLGYTQEFDNAAWTKSNSSITANITTAPDGSLTADKHVPDSGATIGAGASETRVYQSSSVTSGTPYTFTIYAKAGEYDQLALAFITSPSVSALFSLTLGTVVSGTGATITPVGNGWYRCALTATATSTGALQIRWSAKSSTVSTGDGTSGIFIWGAQLSDSASLDSYVYNPVAAPAAAAYYGPRFDYDPVTLAPKGLLIEEQRTNLLLRSQDYSATWFTANVTATANTTDTLDPAGVNGSTKFVMGASGGALGQSVISTAVAHTASIYLKTSSGTTTVDLVLYRNSPFGLVASKTVTLTTSWQRFDLTGTFLDTTSHNFQINFGTNKTVYVWGAQLEAGAFPTSYIPTTTATATRAADVATMIGANFSNWYNASTGSIFTNYATMQQSGFPSITSASDGTNSNRIQLSHVNAGRRPVVTAGGVAQWDTQGGVLGSTTSGVFAKFAMAYEASNYAAVVNGGTPATQSSGSVPVGLNRLAVGADGTSNNFLNGHIFRIAYYNRRLSDAELQGITS
jgi:hypothetical protein